MKIFIPGAGARLIPALKSVPGIRRVIVSIDDPFAAGAFLGDRAYVVPRFDRPGFAEAVLAIHERERFDVCLPVLDSALVFFGRNRDRFARAGFRIAMCDTPVIEVACDKLELWASFRRWGLHVPETKTLAEYLAGRSRPLPSFLKPRYPCDRDFGNAAYADLIDDADVGYWASKLSARLERYIVQPLIRGTEVNIHFFCDGVGTPRSIVALRRIAGRPGDAMSRGEIIGEKRFAPAVRKVTAAIRLWGANELQAFVAPGGEIWYTDLNVRLNGSSPFVRAAGADPFGNTVRLLRGEPLCFPKRPRSLRMTQWDHGHFFGKSPAITPRGRRTKTARRP